MSYIKTWNERCDEHPDHQSGMVSNGMIQARMQEEIDDLRAENERLRAANKQLVEGIDTITRRKQEEIERQRAENDRLRADLATQQSCCDGAAAQDAHIRREREEHRAEARLREVLRDIARKDYSDPFCELTPEGRARKALEGKP